MWISKKKYEVMRDIIDCLWTSYCMNQHTDAMKLLSGGDFYRVNGLDNEAKEYFDRAYRINKNFMDHLKEIVDLFEEYGIYNSDRLERERKYIDSIYKDLVGGN